MISDEHWKILEKANCLLTSNFDTLKNARAEGDETRLKMAELMYFQALQSVLVATQNAIAERAHSNKRNNKIM